MNAMVGNGVHWFRGYFRKVWESRGGGYYGFVGAVTFVYLEALDLAGDIAAVGGVRLDVGWVIGFMVENLISAVMNLVRAAIWPFAWISRFGLGLTTAALLLGTYVAYRLLRPAVLRFLEEPDPGDVPPSSA